MLKESTQKRLLILSGLDKYEKEILKENNSNIVNDVKQFLSQRIEFAKNRMGINVGNTANVWKGIAVELSEILADIEDDNDNINNNVATNIFHLSNIIKANPNKEVQKLNNDLLKLYAKLNYLNKNNPSSRFNNMERDKKGYPMSNEGDTYSKF